MLKIQVINRVSIKPSSPTPNHLSNFKLSSLDQWFSSTYIPIIYFYATDGSNHHISTIEKVQQLKKSLSDTLTSYYPLAGQFKENHSAIECNDNGVEFSEARVHGRLSKFLEKPYIEYLNLLVPCNVLRARSGWDVILAIQVNVFDCGGMAIGVCICHKIADAASLATLMNGWASTSRGETISSPDFQSSKLFPTEGPVTFLGFNIKENIVTKRFLFDKSMIATLRGRPANHLGNHPTRVEAVTALIWRCMMRACGAKEGLSKTSMEMHAVNLRGRMVPPASEYSFGNLLALATSVAMEEECHCHIDIQHYLERKIRDATREIDIDYIKQLQKINGVFRADELMNEKIKKYSNSGRDMYYFSSWCRFPFYDADFGWGRPTWVCTRCWGAKNFTILRDTRDGDGIEAWVDMEDVDMTILNKTRSYFLLLPLLHPLIETRSELGLWT